MALIIIASFNSSPSHNNYFWCIVYSIILKCEFSFDSLFIFSAVSNRSLHLALDADLIQILVELVLVHLLLSLSWWEVEIR